MPVASDGYATKVALFIDAGDRPFARASSSVRSGSEWQTPRQGEKDEIYDYEGRIWSSNMQAGRAIHTNITLPAQLTV